VSAGFSCLAIETSTGLGTVAACRGERITVVQSERPRAGEVYQCVRQVLQELEARCEDLDCIAFGQGPGSFTGMRIAASVAQSLAYGLGLSVCGVSSLELLAREAMRASGAARVACCIDARMQEVYVGAYERKDGSEVRPLMRDALLDPAVAQLDLQGSLHGVGAGWVLYPELRHRHQELLVDVDASLQPSAATLLAVAREHWEQGRLIAPVDALPNYVRNKVTDT